MKRIYAFLLIMWALILAGGGIATAVLGPLEITGLGSLDQAASSVVKGCVAILLVLAWVIILHKLKNWIFFRLRSGTG